MSLSPVGAAPPRLPPPTATPPWHRRSREDAAPAPVFSLYLGVAASAEGDITATLNALDRGWGARAGGLLPGRTRWPSAPTRSARAAGRGHKVGLIPTGDTAEDQVASVDQGSQVLAAILRAGDLVRPGQRRGPDPGGLPLLDPQPHLPAGAGATTTYETLVKAGDGQHHPPSGAGGQPAGQRRPGRGPEPVGGRRGYRPFPPGDPILRTLRLPP